jgi:hypothetical protein
LPINSATAIARAKASIQDLHTALTLSNGERLYAEVVGYCRALRDMDVISNSECAQLQAEASTALTQRAKGPGLLLPVEKPPSYS